MSGPGQRVRKKGRRTCGLTYAELAKLKASLEVLLIALPPAPRTRREALLALQTFGMLLREMDLLLQEGHAASAILESLRSQAMPIATPAIRIYLEACRRCARPRGCGCSGERAISPGDPTDSEGNETDGHREVQRGP